MTTTQWTERSATITGGSLFGYAIGDRLPLSDAHNFAGRFDFVSSTREVTWECDCDEWGRTDAPARIVDESPAKHIGFAS